MVPDRGSVHLGGVKRSSSFTTRRGLNRASSSVLGNTGASVSATIIDLDQMDRQLLGGTRQEFLNSNRGRSPKITHPVEAGKALVRAARSQYRRGDTSQAFRSYRMAIGKLDGRLKDLATVEFRRVFGTAADQSLRMSALYR